MDRTKIEYDRHKNRWVLFYPGREPESYPTHECAQRRLAWLRLTWQPSVECPHCHLNFAATVINHHIREKHLQSQFALRR